MWQGKRMFEEQWRYQFDENREILWKLRGHPIEALMFYGRDKIQLLKTFEPESYITKAIFWKINPAIIELIKKGLYGSRSDRLL